MFSDDIFQYPAFKAEISKPMNLSARHLPESDQTSPAIMPDTAVKRKKSTLLKIFIGIISCDNAHHRVPPGTGACLNAPETKGIL